MTSQTQDRIGWRQIGAGYVVCLCSAAAFASGLWLERLPLLESGITAAVVLGALLVTWLEPHARQVQANWLTVNPGLDLGLKRSAVALLCLISLGTTAFGVMVWRLLQLS